MYIIVILNRRGFFSFKTWFLCELEDRILKIFKMHTMKGIDKNNRLMRFIIKARVYTLLHTEADRIRSQMIL